MRFGHFAAVGAAVAMVASTAAVAAPATRSTAALPTTQALRTATPLKHKSNQSEGGIPVVGYIAGAAVAAAIIVAGVSGKDSPPTAPSSPG
jgi:hypothetical protein